MAKPELGTKRLCASCGAKFYDLNHDPIVCPKCSTVHEIAPVPQRGGRPEAARPVVPQEAELPETQEAEFISLEEADAEAEGKKKKGTAGEEIPDVEEEVEMDESLDDAAFIEETEEEDADVSEILGGDIEDEEET
ncbi:MAG: TIGR02300 family protein [Rhodoplanes sp.]